MFRYQETPTGVDVMKDVGLRLKALRNEAGLSVRAIAEEWGIPSSTYARREDETKKPFLPMEWALPLADILERHGIDRNRVLYLAGQGATSLSENEIEVVAWLQAGEWVENNEIPFDQRTRIRWPFKQPKPDGVQAFEVRGDGMDLSFPSGSTVFAVDSETLSHANKAVIPGDKVIIRRDRVDGKKEHFIRELGEPVNGVYPLLPRSRNLRHQSIPYQPDQEWYIGRDPSSANASKICIAAVLVGALINYMPSDPA